MAFWSDNRPPLVQEGGGAKQDPKREFKFLAYFGGDNNLQPYVVKSVDRPKLEAEADIVRRHDRRLVLGQNMQVVNTPIGNHTITFADAGGSDDVSFFFYKLMREAGDQSLFSYPDGATKKIDFSLYHNVFQKRLPMIRLVTLGAGGSTSLLGSALSGLGGNTPPVIEEFMYYDPVPISIDFGKAEYEREGIVEVSFTFQPSYITMNADNFASMMHGTGPTAQPTNFEGGGRKTLTKRYGESKLLPIKM